MVLTKLRFIYKQFFVYMYTVLDCLYNHLYVGPRTILIGIVDQNLKFMMGLIHLDILFINLSVNNIYRFFDFEVTLIFRISDFYIF